jgi:hypothetical protein
MVSPITREVAKAILDPEHSCHANAVRMVESQPALLEAAEACLHQIGTDADLDDKVSAPEKYDDLEELLRKVVAAAHDSTVKPAYDGAHCPNCNSEDIESDGVFSEGDLAICFANVECHSCGATWRELFALDGFDGLEVQVPKKGE